MTRESFCQRRAKSYAQRMSKKKESKTLKSLSKTQRRRREDIIDASLKIFERDGFESAKMSDIAEEAEVAKGTLYLYFENKGALLEGVIQSAIIPTLQAADDTAQSHQGTATELLTKQLKIMGKRMASPEMRMLLRYMMSGNTEQHRKVVEFYFQNVIQTGLSLLRSTIHQGVENGEFKKDALDVDPLALLGAQIYTTVWKSLFDELAPIDPVRLGEDFTRVVLEGLTKR